MARNGTRYPLNPRCSALDRSFLRAILPLERDTREPKSIENNSADSGWNREKAGESRAPSTVYGKERGAKILSLLGINIGLLGCTAIKIFQDPQEFPFPIHKLSAESITAKG